jgi:hypothetical protein
VPAPEKPLDLDHLLKLRLVIARVGEMDNAQWWNTKGVLGRHGKVLYSRGFPKTHPFAQARAVFEVARTRCREVFDLPGTWTLWKLPAPIEAAFDERWPIWLDAVDAWQPFFKQLTTLEGEADACAALSLLELLPSDTREAFKALRREHDGRSVALPKAAAWTDERVRLLAAGFGRGEAQALAVPYLKVEA